MELVSVIKLDEYDINEVFKSVKKSIEIINFKIPKNKTILIKPNILAQNRPEQHSITHYTVVDAVCRIFKETNCKIMIGESISFYEKGLTRKAFITSKIKEVADKYNAELIPFDEKPLIRITGKLTGLKEIYLPEILFKADYVINVPKLKTHGGLRLTGAIKNMFGCMPGGYKQKIHILVNNDFELSDIFIDIWGLVKPQLTVMDAVIGLDGGPSAIGKPVKVGRILASTNPAALDIIAAKTLGYKPEEISTLVRAKSRKMITDYNNIKIIGELPEIKFKKLIKGPIRILKKKDDMFITDTFVTPIIKYSKCNLCYECIKFCPVKAINKTDNNFKIFFDYKKCISCYYCLSACPNSAIKIRSSFKNKFMRFMRFILNI